jgi:hypothetical protein
VDTLTRAYPAMALPTGHRLYVADDSDAVYGEYFSKYMCMLYIFINICMYVVCFG